MTQNEIEAAAKQTYGVWRGLHGAVYSAETLPWDQVTDRARRRYLALVIKAERAPGSLGESLIHQAAKSVVRERAEERK